VLEYSNYRTGNGESGLLRSFSTALSFIEADAFIKDEYYLAGFDDDKQDDSEFTFYFDYVVNNFPLELPSEYQRKEMQSGEASIGNAIEVVVREGSVVNYKKIVYNFVPDNSEYITNLDFNSVLAEFGPSQNENHSRVRDVVLGYKLEQNKKASLYWKIRIGEHTFSKMA
jgi:hypothetical protein